MIRGYDKNESMLLAFVACFRWTTPVVRGPADALVERVYMDREDQGQQSESGSRPMSTEAAKLPGVESAQRAWWYAASTDAARSPASYIVKLCHKNVTGYDNL